MKVCVLGAGAIGGLLGVKLAMAGEKVSLVARGAHLAAIRENGLKLIEGDSEHVVRNIPASNKLADLGVQDVVLLALKAHQIESILEELPALLGPDTVIVTLQNGIPWWYFQKLGGVHENRVVETVDPNGVLAKSIDPNRLLGCIAYPAATVPEPGVIKHVEGYRFPLGEIDGSRSDRAKTVSEMFIKAGFKSPVLDDIRSEIWLKLWGNLSFNPISAMTHGTLEGICKFAPTRKLAADMMTEAQSIAEKLGAVFRVPLEKRIAGAEKVGKHKTSMLQDVEAGKPLEIDGMLGAVVELGEVTEIPTPRLEAVYALTRLLGKTMQDENLAFPGKPLG